MPTAPGSTLAALQAGSNAFKWVIAIEGYTYLFSDAAASEVTTAWTGTDWSQALTGITVALENEQRLSPWEPFPEGGSLIFYVPAQSPTSDPFGVDTGRSTAGAETILDPGTNQGIDNDDTTATVRSATGFGGGGSSGTVYIGSETIAFTGKTSTTLTGLTRGKFAPFAVSGGTRFGHQHRVRLDENAVQLAPLVTEQPRSWIGRWVGAWLHRYDHGTGLMNTKANAQLCYAGRVVSVRDDEATAKTVVECEHVLRYVGDAVLCQNQWSATVLEGIDLQTNWTFTMKDTGNGGTNWHTANDMVVGGSGPNDIAAGFYTVEQLHSAINDWFAAELAAARIVGTYSLGIAPWNGDQNKPHTYFSYRIPGAGPTVNFQFTLRREVSDFLGDIHHGALSTTTAFVQAYSSSQPNTDYDIVSALVPMRNDLVVWDKIQVTSERGVFEDQSASLPAGAQWQSTLPNNGIFLIDNKYVVAGHKVGTTIDQLMLMSSSTGITYLHDALTTQTRMDDGSAPLSIKQIFMFEDTFANVFAKLLYSTGTSGYNHATYDVYPAAVGLAIPDTLLGSAFIDSLNALPCADSPITVVIEKPKKLMDIIGGDLMFRWAFLRWKSGGIQLSTWKTPLPSVGSILSDANKAAPPSNNDAHRASTLLTDEWQASIIKVNYNRDITDLTADGGYRDSLTIEDRTAVEDAGGQPRTRTINLANTYGQNVQQGAGVEGLKDGFMALAPMMATRPVRRVSRTIDSRFFEGYSIGDSVLFTDKFARDPDTGLRGVQTRPAIIVMHRWTLGGPDPKGDGISDVNGEVELLLMPLLRVGPYVPSAQLDDTSTNSGYVIATKIATCYAHKFSESGEAADASYMSVGRKIRFIELDPANPAAPSTFDDTVAAQSGNTVTLTTGFAAFDNTKKYVMVWDTYGDAIANQQTFSYQADDADGMIFDARAPYQYVSGTNFSAFTANSNDIVDLPPDITFGDAVGLDVATQVSINRLINNLIDYKTAHFEEWLTNGEIAPVKLTGSAVYELIECRPINLTGDNLLSTPKRVLTVAPFFRSSDGTSASVRVTLVKQPPGDNTTSDVTRGGVLAEAIFTTTTTTYATATPATLNIGALKDLSGNAFLLVELTLKARFRGLAQAQEGPRS
jgi:hypothetical protein